MSVARKFAVILVVGLSALPLARAGDAAYPLRAVFPNEPVISTPELAKAGSSAVVVDVRSALEYKVLHIKGAVNLVEHSMTRESLAALRAPDAVPPLVFYCNGTTCAKSYEACQRARAWGFKNVFVYDDGPMPWAKSHPELTSFMGHPMTAADVKRLVEMTETYEKHTLPSGEFIAKALSGTFKVYDVRDPDQRTKAPVMVPGMVAQNLDQFMAAVEGGKVPKAGVVLLDNVGKQTPWLHLMLQQKGFTNYFFLKGGALQWKADGYDPTGKKSS